jgi:2',3'-cyclic-nucleotide 2'-phosphodiesterase (5'-nucleotidase family)
VTLLFSGYVGGNFGPCGCENNPTGGLARRVGYASQYKATTGDYVLHVDAGNYFQPIGPLSKQINDHLLDGLRDVPIQVLNLAPEDLYLWESLVQYEYLKDRLISTNLFPRDSATPRPALYKIIVIPASELGTRSDVRIGFLGLSDPAKVKPNSGFSGKDPSEALAQVLPELEGRVDFLVVLADIPRLRGRLKADSLLYRIAESHPLVHAVLSTERRYLLHSPEQVNNAVVLSSIERGRYLGQLRLQLDATGQVVAYEPDFIEMNDRVPEDPGFLSRQFELEKRIASPDTK